MENNKPSREQNEEKMLEDLDEVKFRFACFVDKFKRYFEDNKKDKINTQEDKKWK